MSKRLDMPAALKVIRDLLLDRQYKNGCIEALTKQLEDIQPQVLYRRELQQLIGDIEKNRDILKEGPCITTKNLPCILYAWGFDPPLPSSCDDATWPEKWDKWLTLLKRKRPLELAEAESQPSTAETYQAKLEVYVWISRLWWDRLRDHAGMPCWLKS